MRRKYKYPATKDKHGMMMGKEFIGSLVVHVSSNIVFLNIVLLKLYYFFYHFTLIKRNLKVRDKKIK